MDEKLFDSYTNPIPPLRYDIQVIPVEQNGDSFLYFHDQHGYATPNFALPLEARAILSLIDGNRSVEEIIRFSVDDVSKEQVLGYVRFLDEHALLQSDYFEEHADLLEEEYEKSDVHISNTAGVSYPEKPGELTRFLDQAFETHDQSEPAKTARALYAPHIDLRVGLGSYVKAFSTLKNLRPGRVVLLATSHYSGLHPGIYDNKPFIISKKHFEMPNGEVKAERKSIREIEDRVRNDESYGVSFQDRAHRIEHSIELHLLFLNYLWSHDFEIVPVLVGGLDELFYMENGFQGQQVEKFSGLLNNLFAHDKDTFFLISGDLSHVGRKFGDTVPAAEMMDDIKNFDDSFLDFGANARPERILELMKENYDPYRVCGYPPLYTFLNAYPELKGKRLSYDIWDETERESAVSFGSILYE